MQMTTNFWILWCALCVGMGAGFTMLNNLAQIVESLGGDKQAQGVYVLLFTTVNTIGRMTAGYLPERLLHARGTPRWGTLAHHTSLVDDMSIITSILKCKKLGPGKWHVIHSLRSSMVGTAHVTFELHPVQDHLCAGGIRHDMPGGHSVSIHQPAVAAGLRNGVRLCLWVALEPHAGLPHLACPYSCRSL